MYRRWCFTLNNPSNRILIEGGDTSKIKIVVYQLEVGENGTPHYQGFIVTVVPVRLAALKKINSHAHYEKMNKPLAASLAYCTKLEGRLSDPVFWPNEQYVRDFVSSNGQSVKKQRLSDVVALIEAGEDVSMNDKYILHMKNIDSTVEKRILMADKSRLQKNLQNAQLRPWQMDLISALDKQTDRQVLWVYDVHGNAGKSWFAKYLYGYKNYLYFENKSKLSDIAHLVATTRPSGVCFDIPRSAYKLGSDKVMRHTFSYGSLESLKNGMISSTKYQGCCSYVGELKVLVFSNNVPELDQLSLDRWQLCRIDDNQLVKLQGFDESAVTTLVSSINVLSDNDYEDDGLPCSSATANMVKKTRTYSDSSDDSFVVRVNSSLNKK